MQKQVIFKTKGMQRDLSASAFNSEYAYENKNVRVMPTDESTLLSLINEKGNKKSSIAGVGDYIKGIPIGQALVNDELVIFTAGNDKDSLYTNIEGEELEIDNIAANELTIDIDCLFEDRIYKLWFNNDVLTGKRLFRGDLGFNYKYPIEALSFYENEEIQKVYWTDGINQPRVINIAAASNTINKWNNTSFNFVRKITLQETVNISRNIVANGSFASGVIQYVFTYFDKYGQESNIFYASPLYYISYNNRGASPEDKVSNSFNIEINNVDNSFDYVRVYSIHRTSINATPDVRKVVDLAPSLDLETNTYKVTYTDTGSLGDSIDPTELLYVGGEEVIFGTMSQKDNTLFLGDIKINRKNIDSTVRDFFKNNNISFETYTKKITPPKPKGYYPYKNQLNLNSYQFKTFKYLEWYRFGIQAQHYTGKWSDPIWINDAQNTKPISTTFYKDDNITLPVAKFLLSDANIINKLIEDGYVRIRPVIVYPSINDREVICQGVLCPTVYNVADRYSNSPFVQSSWFTRPNAPFDEYKAFHYRQSTSEEWGGDYLALGNYLSGEATIYSRAGIMSNNTINVTNSEGTYLLDSVNKGAWAEFRHNYPIPGNDKRNAEIQCIYNPPEIPNVLLEATESDVRKYVSDNSENYYVDQSIVTFHSPDIEFDNDVRSLDTSTLKLRIVGMVPITSFISDIDIQTSTPVNNFYESSEQPLGFYKESIGVENNFTGDAYGDSHFGWRGLISGAFWFDELTGYKKDTGNNKHLTTGFVVYPWHRNGSLNNTRFASDGYRSAMLDKKKMSNLRFSYKTFYFRTTNIWNAYIENDDNHTGISGVKIFDSNEISVVRIPAPENSGLSDFNYYGNVDKLLTVSRVGSKKDGYPIMTSGVQNAETNAHTIFRSNYTQVDSSFTDQVKGVDPVRIKYKSTPHAVIALNYTKNHAVRVLPTIKDFDPTIPQGANAWVVNGVSKVRPDYRPFWQKEKTGILISQDAIMPYVNREIDAIGSIQYGWLWLGELYNDNVQNRFGGKTDEAFENNQWLPCGEPVSLINSDNTVKDSITIEWKEGDTYYQRYDHIKTYPFTLEDQNAVTDIISFMCETRVNLDGRYDRNRGQTSNFSITPENFNLMNDVYSQPNNFFNYRAINPNKLNLDNFHNSITWTKTKTAGELIDTWTNITLASTLDLDGDKGPVRALRRLNNNIVTFQDRGISQILYNENMQISSTDGVPIEIANSGKVNGKRYISDRIGCTNKWSICETSNGIYFIDDITKGIFLFNGQLNNISDKFGFHSWINRASKNISIWNPVDFDGFVTYYDKVNGDVFFISKEECLAFSEPLGQFSSFYSYEKMPYFTNLEDRGIALNVEGTGTLYRPWLHNEGDYNMFFGVYQPFYTTVIANPDMPVDKIFNNLEFRSDSWDKNGNLLNTTFDTLNVWNEYQEGTSTLSNTLDRPSSLKKKFRIWRANIPRSKANGRDRMRNPWLYIKLSMEEENVNKTVLHDMIVHYFE